MWLVAVMSLKNCRTLRWLSNNHGLLQSTTNRKEWVASSAELRTANPCNMGACIRETLVSQLRETLGQRTTVSKRSSLVSMQHTSTKNELSLACISPELENTWCTYVSSQESYCCLHLQWDTNNQNTLCTNAPSYLYLGSQTSCSIGHLVFNCPKQLMRL